MGMVFVLKQERRGIQEWSATVLCNFHGCLPHSSSYVVERKEGVSVIGLFAGEAKPIDRPARGHEPTPARDYRFETVASADVDSTMETQKKKLASCLPILIIQRRS